MGPGNTDGGLSLAADTRPKPFVFVLMPFAVEFDDTYHQGIRATCQQLGLHCQRADEQIFDGTILDNVYTQIARADVVVAEMSGRNPNVFYETGYAHALGKQVILLTREAADIPFDLSQYPHIVYEGQIDRLKDGLERRLQWVLDNPRGSLARVEHPLAFLIAGRRLEGPVVIPYHLRAAENMEYMELELAIHNESRRPVQTGQVQLAIVTPEDVSGANSMDGRVHLADGRYLFAFKPLPPMFPDAWCAVTLGMVKERGHAYEADTEAQFVIRCYTELGATDFPFTVHFTIETAPAAAPIASAS